MASSDFAAEPIIASGKWQIDRYGVDSLCVEYSERTLAAIRIRVSNHNALWVWMFKIFKGQRARSSPFYPQLLLHLSRFPAMSAASEQRGFSPFAPRSWLFDHLCEPTLDCPVVPYTTFRGVSSSTLIRGKFSSPTLFLKRNLCLDLRSLASLEGVLGDVFPAVQTERALNNEADVAYVYQVTRC